MLAEEDKNAEEKSPLDGRLPLVALSPHRWPRCTGAWGAGAVCQARPLHVVTSAHTWQSPSWEALQWSARAAGEPCALGPHRLRTAAIEHSGTGRCGTFKPAGQTNCICLGPGEAAPRLPPRDTAWGHGTGWGQLGPGHRSRPRIRMATACKPLMGADLLARQRGVCRTPAKL